MNTANSIIHLDLDYTSSMSVVSEGEKRKIANGSETMLHREVLHFKVLVGGVPFATAASDDTDYPHDVSF